jgi:hypothetical protein
VNLGVGVVGHVKAELLKTTHEEGVEGEQFSVAEEEEVLAKKGLWVGCGDFNVGRILKGKYRQYRWGGIIQRRFPDC